MSHGCYVVPSSLSRSAGHFLCNTAPIGMRCVQRRNELISAACASGLMKQRLLIQRVRMKFPGRGQEFTTLLGGGLAVFLFASAAAQDGYYGVGHDKWHQNFYSKLKR